MSAIPLLNRLGTGSGTSGITFSFNQTRYFLADNNATTTEANAALPLPAAGVLSKLDVYVSANSIATTATTVRNRIATANGAQSVSIAAGATGWFQDMSNTDTVSAGNLFTYQIVTPNTSGTITLMTATNLFAATTNTISEFWTALFSTTLNSATRFVLVKGSNTFNATEALVQVKSGTGGTLKRLMALVSTNGRSTAVTIRSRVNTANGAQSASITAATTGLFQDASNTDTIVATDLFNLSFTTSTGGGTLQCESMGVALEATDGSGMLVSSGVTGALGTTVTRHIALGGHFGTSATETDAQLYAQGSLTLSLLSAYLLTNTVSATSTLTSRINAGAGNQSVSITASTTGRFEDAVNSDSVIDTDLINTRLVTGGTGTSLSLSMVHMKAVVPAVGGGPVIPVFMHQYRRRAA
jgi:hypothetical protein